MDALDIALLNATPKARSDRPLGDHLSKPLRSWSLCLRAGDRRWLPGVPHEEMREPPPVAVPREAQDAEALALTAGEVRGMCAPIDIDRPGVPIAEAAERFGVAPLTIRRWIDRGLFVAEPIGVGTPSPYPTRFPTTHYTLVWTPSGLDPAGEVWSPSWGARRRHMIDDLTDDFQQNLWRVRRPIGAQGAQWQWLCPACGAMVFKVYLPMLPLDVRQHLHVPLKPGGPPRGYYTLTDDAARFVCRKCAGLVYESTELTSKDSAGKPCDWFDRFIQRMTRGALKAGDLTFDLDDPVVEEPPTIPAWDGPVI